MVVVVSSSKTKVLLETLRQCNTVVGVNSQSRFHQNFSLVFFSVVREARTTSSRTEQIKKLIGRDEFLGQNISHKKAS